MRALPLPTTGPIHLDVRDATPAGATRSLDDTLRRMKPGSRQLVIRVASEAVLHAVTGWAVRGEARHEVEFDAGQLVVRLYLLPPTLGGHPSQAFHRPLRLGAAALVALGDDAEATAQP